ncbi:vacuolar protein-sorting-associated protein 39 [Ceratobasidium sp. AG-Ba]|nr:vacuolar protein-sorting-associated protein 39 [Ceratobasidium sp. AG-Ba]QRW03854.1 vacuolar protein-sorting-associated protein 39 [Ceratobasidium sp. AG-Ba]
MAYPPPDNAVLSLANMALTEFVLPATNTVTQNAGMSMGMGMGMGALSGLGGYMGLGSKAKHTALKIEDGEVLIPKESTGLFFGADGKTTRQLGVDWPAPPEETVYTKPYIISSFPPNSLPASGLDHSASATSLATLTQTATIPNSALQIRSSISLQPVQTIRFPFIEDSTPPAPAKPGAGSKQAALPPPHTLRLLTITPGSGPSAPTYLLSTPTDRAALASEGSTLWALLLRPWATQVDELVHAGKYADALALLKVVPTPLQPDPTRHVQGLRAVQLFKEGVFEKAVEMFLELDTNPAKEKWIGLFGGDPPPKMEEPIAEVDEKSVAVVEGTSEEDAQRLAATVGVTPASPPSEPVQSPPTSISGGITGKLKAGLGAMKIGDADADSTREAAAPKGKKGVDEFTLSIRALDMLLADRRAKIPAALQPFGITAAQSADFPALSAASIDELMALPSAPLGTLTPDQLVRAAQLVDTALFRLYLISRPSYIGVLCRVDNWCEVTEVEEALKGRKKFTELIDLYKGKKMHAKALNLLHELSQSEDDPLDKYEPTIRYLQKLGPEYQELVFQSARWIFEAKPDMAFDIFTTEEVELPRAAVADYLEGIDPMLGIRFIEYLFGERQEESLAFGDRLGELYLRSAVQFRKAKESKEYEQLYSKLIAFVNTSKFYHPDRLYALLPPEELYEARAILLGKLGNHQGALEIYVKKMQDYTEAEEYCKRVYQTEPDPHGVFLTLLKIFLQPTSSTTPSLLRPALDLISRQSPRIDPVETLKLLPPLVKASDLRTFLTESLRTPKVDTRIERELWLARSQQADRRVAALHTRRVRVTDSRICPQCNKRLGNSVVAVHMPRGEVTHYQCREAFSKRLNDPQRRGL